MLHWAFIRCYSLVLASYIAFHNGIGQVLQDIHFASVEVAEALQITVIKSEFNCTTQEHRNTTPRPSVGLKRNIYSRDYGGHDTRMTQLIVVVYKHMLPPLLSIIIIVIL